MSWNPSPQFGGALWSGNGQIATQQELLSTSKGLSAEIINYSTISLSTLIVPDWISTSVIYASDIKGANIDISGLVIDASGVFYADTVSSTKGGFTIINNISTIQMTFAPQFSGSFNVSFDLGLGKAIGGFLAGLGAAVGGAFIGVGTGLGLAISGAEQGIATIIAGRPQNFITNNTYETINFTSQLQVSTLGNAYPVYSSIFRTVSSSSANQVPGKEIFTSSFFYPGQICIRSASDPINLVTGDSNLNTSTIQSFGQWVPLEGLEPDNVIANSVVTNTLSSGTAFIGNLSNNALTVETLNVGNFPTTPQTAAVALEYEVPLQFRLGAVNYAQLVGDVNYMYIQSDQDILFTKRGPAGTPGSVATNASLSMGSNANESILTVSTLNSSNVNAITGNFSSLTVTSLTVISTVTEVFSTQAITVLSTGIVTTNFIAADYGNISSLAPFKFFSTTLGNPNGPFDISRYDSLFSTTYNSVSSLQQNILNYSLNIQVQDEATFNIGDNPGIGLTYKVTPANISQWASTQIIFDGYQGPGGIDLGWVGQWGVSPGQTGGVAPGGATFDVFYGPSPAQQYQYSAPFYLTEQSNQAYPVGLSTFYAQSNPDLPYPVTFTARMTLPPIVGGTRSGWWQMTTPCPPPYTSSNNNTFQVYQDINDTYISATDRLHLQAGDIFLDGALNLSNLQVQNLTTNTLNTNNAFLNSTFAQQINVSSLASQSYSNVFNFTGSYNNIPPTQPLNFQFNLNSTDFANIRFLTVPSRGPNMFSYMNVNEWNNTVYNQPTGTSATTGGPQIFLGDFIARPYGCNYGPAKFWVNNTTSPAVPFPVAVVRSGGWLSTIGSILPAGTGISLIQTPDGSNWSITSNVPNPQGSGGYSYSNNYQLYLNQDLTQLNVGMPYTEVVSGTKTIMANKIILNAAQIRTLTYASPSFPTREAGFELSVYFDQDIVFTGTQSDAVNPIVSPQGNLGYSVTAWQPIVSLPRIRTATLGIQGFEIEPQVGAISGTAYDLIWFSHRYLNCASDGTADCREYRFMLPINYMTEQNNLGPY